MLQWLSKLVCRLFFFVFFQVSQANYLYVLVISKYTDAWIFLDGLNSRPSEIKQSINGINQYLFVTIRIESMVIVCTKYWLLLNL